MHIATASSNIKVHKLPELEFVCSFLQSSEFVTWNCDNTILASSGSECNIYLHDADETKESISFATETTTDVIRFSNKSANILGRSGEGCVALWDINNMTPFRKFQQLPTKALSLAFSMNDSLLSVGCEAGHIQNWIKMYDLSNESFVDPYASIGLPKTECASRIEYSVLKSNSMACGTTLGNLNLIDWSSGKVVHVFKPQVESPCVEVCYSPINDLLLTSLNKNGHLGFFDTNSSRLVRLNKLGIETTCMKILVDGTKLIIGTQAGRLELFDLRAKFVSLHSIKAHDSAIKCISIQKSLEESGLTKKNPKLKKLFKNHVNWS